MHVPDLYLFYHIGETEGQGKLPAHRLRGVGQVVNLRPGNHVLEGEAQRTLGTFMRNWLFLILLSALSASGWATQPDHLRERAAAPLAPVRSERLLPTPPAIIRFGWTVSDLADLVGGLRASTQTSAIAADRPGVLEFVCSPDSILPWGTPLFRVYDLDLLGDLARAQEFAALIGSRPFVVAPRDFPAPLSRVGRATVPPPPVLLPVLPEVKPPTAPTDPPEPIVRMPASRPPAEPERAVQPPPPPPQPKTDPDPAAVQAASVRLAAAEERVTSMRALLATAQSDLKSAQQTVAPLRDDVAARRRLLEAGVVARNDVKAAEERLEEAEAALSAASARVAEAQGALDAAEADRDAALAGAERAKSTPSAPAEPPPAVVSRSSPRLAPPPPPPSRIQPPPPAPAPRHVDDFPSPIAGPSAALPPPPAETFRLARRGDLPGEADWGPLPWPAGGSAELARQRWAETKAPWQCVVSRAMTPQGSIVQKGTPVLELRPTSAARLTAEVAEPYVGFCRVGAAVEVEFPTYGVAYLGWVSSVEPTHAPRPPGARVEMLLVQAAKGDRPVYHDLEWMALSSPVTQAEPDPLAYEAPNPEVPSATHLAALFPLPHAAERAATSAPPDGQLCGRPELYCSERATAFGQSDPVAQKKLERLREWHDSFIEGMKTTVFPESGLTLTYPREGEVSTAVERLATRRVSHVPNRCAGTLAEALGWSLGDAAMWATGLPERGYKMREDGIPRPGDILVWPFTFGPRRSQHVGIAVGQAGAVMLLSNLEGVLGTQPLCGGYLAFYRAPAQTKGNG
ncbi:MAG: HlyD family efflux transporter periplasmic adaptor subunit [Gemmatimonadetes bacterium]|nr:HlyD family efflux transporter periplasmic adaptor subunit [Gemmatimonadota bacterium]